MATLLPIAYQPHQTLIPRDLAPSLWREERARAGTERQICARIKNKTDQEALVHRAGKAVQTVG